MKCVGIIFRWYQGYHELCRYRYTIHYEHYTYIYRWIDWYAVRSPIRYGFIQWQNYCSVPAFAITSLNKPPLSCPATFFYIFRFFSVGVEVKQNKAKTKRSKGQEYVKLFHCYLCKWSASWETFHTFYIKYFPVSSLLFISIWSSFIFILCQAKFKH